MEGTLEYAVGQRDLAVIQSFLDDPPLTFSEQGKFLGLRPSRDYRYANLKHTDFTDSNLSGYDFTGSDLSGSYGINTIWDHSTILKDASISGSIFSFKYAAQKFFRDNPKFNDELLRLQAEDYAESFFYVGRTLKIQTIGARQKGLYFAKSLFISATNPVAKNNMLYCIRAYAENDEENRDFLIYLFTAKEHDYSTIKSALSIAGQLYGSQEVIKGILGRYLSDNDPQIRLIALNNLMRVSTLAEIQAGILPKMLNEPVTQIRLKFLEGLAVRMNISRFIISPLGEKLDYASPISMAALDEIGRSVARHQKQLKARENPASMKGVFSVAEPSKGELELAREETLQAFDKLRKFGVPFQIANLRRESA